MIQRNCPDLKINMTDVTVTTALCERLTLRRVSSLEDSGIYWTVWTTPRRVKRHIFSTSAFISPTMWDRPTYVVCLKTYKKTFEFVLV